MKKIISSIFLFHCLTAALFAQTNGKDSTSGEQRPEVTVEEVTDYAPPPFDTISAISAVEEAAPAVEYTRPFNEMKHDERVKPEKAPDRKARYSAGAQALLRQINSGLSVPYHYGSEPKAFFVILRVTVGADSMLYNPVTMSTPGVNYTGIAQHAIEALPERFVPAMKNGKPVASYLYIPIRFEFSLYTAQYRYNQK